jgi:NADPH-dependent ferric siderophore reductase
MTAMNTGRKRARRYPPRLWRAPVLRTARVTPRMARVTIGGEQLADFPGAGGDQHVVLYFYPDGVTPPEPLTLETARVGFASARPQMRSYTVRRFDPVAHELDLDFVLHGDEGPASAWAERVQPGDDVILVGPSPAYLLDPEVPAHLLAGDETALPAIGTMLAELPAGLRVQALIEVADAAEEQPLPTAATAEITWLHRAAGQTLLPALRALELPDPAGLAVWAAGERTAMQELRAHLLTDRGLDRHRVRPTSYWRTGQAGSA